MAKTEKNIYKAVVADVAKRLKAEQSALDQLERATAPAVLKPAIAEEPAADSLAELRSIRHGLIHAIDAIAQAERNEIFLDAVFFLVDFSQKEGLDSPAFDQAIILLEAWFERGRPSWKHLSEDLIKVLDLCNRFAEKAE